MICKHESMINNRTERQEDVLKINFVSVDRCKECGALLYEKGSAFEQLNDKKISFTFETDLNNLDLFFKARKHLKTLMSHHVIPEDNSKFIEMFFVDDYSGVFKQLEKALRERIIG